MNHSVEDTETNSVTLQEENQQALPEAGRVDIVRWKFTLGPSFKHLFLKKKKVDIERDIFSPGSRLFSFGCN